MGGFNVRLLISYYPDRALSPTCFPFFITSTPHTSSFNPLRSPQVIITVKYRHKSTDIPSQDEDWSIYKTAITHNFLPIPFISSSCFCCYWSTPPLHYIPHSIAVAEADPCWTYLLLAIWITIINQITTEWIFYYAFYVLVFTTFTPFIIFT